ncbi:auxin-responsive protein IAA10-like isoform X2 [Canna indica]|uniref:Auxin-responsive protein n=1 Tax=Canna indica TaxID=4628 RepID=A0AAQ3L053_9LILI|nr:auxin-responsive protein IAA10-like isoform X2 [Canna indica]
MAFLRLRGDVTLVTGSRVFVFGVSRSVGPWPSLRVKGNGVACRRWERVCAKREQKVVGVHHHLGALGMGPGSCTEAMSTWFHEGHFVGPEVNVSRDWWWGGGCSPWPSRSSAIKRVRSPPCSAHSSRFREREREKEKMMEGVCGFDGGVASPGSVSSVSKVAAPEDLVVEDVGGGAATAEAEEEELVGNDRSDYDDELELGLTLGAARRGRVVPARWGPCCRILTAKDFPSLASLASPRSPSASSVSSSSGTNLAATGVAGTKRAAESASPDVGGSPHPPSQVVVGWPPIRAFRMNSLFNHSKDSSPETDSAVAIKKTNVIKDQRSHKDQESRGTAMRSSLFVKVKMDGDPIGRKVDLTAHHSYESLAISLELMFQKPSMAASAVHGAMVLKLLDGSSEFALTYEDRDGDWMLVGDVPWGMFLETVKRLRIMRTSDANGLSKSFHFGKHQDFYPLRRPVD